MGGTLSKCLKDARDKFKELKDRKKWLSIVQMGAAEFFRFLNIFCTYNGWMMMHWKKNPASRRLLEAFFASFRDAQ